MAELLNWRKIVIAAVLATSGLPAVAADSCSVWLRQPNGVEWRQCVRDNGTAYCQERNGNNITTISCT